MKRGAWVLDRMLGTPPKPPPPDVPAVEPDIRGAVTLREQLAKHKSLATCASCHVHIDPPGFALESYDVVGGCRDFYRVKQGKCHSQSLTNGRLRNKDGDGQQLVSTQSAAFLLALGFSRLHILLVPRR